MHSKIGETLLGRPQFGTPVPKDTPLSSLFETRSIKLLKPSDHNPYSFWGRILSILFRFISLFVTPKRPSAITFKALAGSGSAPQKEMLQLFKQCLADQPSSTSTLQQYENLLKELHDLKTNPLEHQRLRKKVEFQSGFKHRIMGLKNGESLLLPITAQEDSHIFYLIKREQSGFSLKVIGCDQWMPQISGTASKKVGGKEKVLSQISFQNIPEDFFTDERVETLFSAPLMDNCFNATQIKAVLGTIPANCRVYLSDKSELWVTQSNQSRKALGLVLETPQFQ